MEGASFYIEGASLWKMFLNGRCIFMEDASLGKVPPCRKCTLIGSAP